MSQTAVEIQLQVPSSQLSKTGELQRTSSRSLSPYPDDVFNQIRNNDQNELGNVYQVKTKGKTVLIITAVTLVTGTASMLNGMITVSLPTLAIDLGIGPDLLFWPSSIQALTCGCTLLLSGSIADAIGARYMYLIGTLLQTAFVLGCGLSRNPLEIILFRGLSGIAASFCLPSAVSIITSSFTGHHRNVAFAFMGGGQPAGFIIGLVLGGILTDLANWRVEFYGSSAVTAVTFALNLWGLSTSTSDDLGSTWKQRWHQITHEIDWIGAIISSTCLGLMSYVLVSVTGNVSNIQSPTSIALLATSIALIPTFIFWVGRQERLGKPALIPNSLWRNKVFTVICITVFFSWGAVEALETILTFYFQNVQNLSALQTSIRFLPAAATGILANIVAGSLVHRAPGNVIVVVGLAISCVAPLVMAFAKPTSSYWSSGFVANLLNPIGSDGLFTVANLLITSVFPAKTQGLAGGVFNTVSQIGKSVGLVLVALIAGNITSETRFANKSSPDALMVGYRAAFWFCFALCTSTLALALWGLHRIGKVGHKRE
ncbi:integral membrane protein [Xylona heveae TC161]|uniref:Integral membrane protein n=1 Tax=Xylona heveae (strain CBS 132557 / TC161) TaxID=1328760 RepID=A0A165K394_XYLHT|nr:integral membrane protein [Xylona heveae TC161]KZF26937.1 integral membrane protein [Xylona heveae TC161]